jgi:uncharacterized surface protein with fasciclin (FAS1) repeats
MKTLPLVAATLSITALGAAVSTPSARAQDTTTTTTTTAGQTTDKPTVQTSPTTGQPVVVVPTTANAADQYKAMWAYRNLDDREVRRHRAAGFTDDTIKGAANIALRTGLTVDYVLRRIREVGEPLAYVALEHNISADQLKADIPGYGLETISVMAPGTSSTPSMQRSGMMRSSTDTMVSSTSSSVGSTSSSSLPGSVSAASGTAAGTGTSSAQGNVVDVVLGNPDFSTLATALRSAELVDMLRGAGPYTVFAPTNAAFAKLPAGAVDDLMKPENRERLRSVLQNHVLPGRIMAADVMAMSNPSTPRTAGGGTLNVKTTAPIMVNDANVTATDIVATNGVIHIIDTVLMPAASSDAAATPAPAAADATAPAAPATPADPAAPATP